MSKELEALKSLVWLLSGLMYVEETNPELWKKFLAEINTPNR